jgi:DNA-binding NtrC family response regulator
METARGRPAFKAKILVVDDDPDIVTVLQDRLEALGYSTICARDGAQALDLIEQESPHLLLLDLEMPRMSGLDVLARLAQQKPAAFDMPVIVMTAHGTIAKAVHAMKQGAYDFLTKPFEFDHLAIVIAKALERTSLARQVECLRAEIDSRYAAIIGQSPAMQAVIELAQRVASSDAGVLLLGESGTGKELFARWIHRWSPRRAMPFVVINCVALTESLLENELFGHEKGAFTGADRMAKGKIELADGGTLFLDEIGDMPLPLQAKLLRVLQDHEFQRVGGTRMVRVNIRVVAATNRDLKRAVKEGRFREDLFFRLNVVTLNLPPLRERPEDLEPLALFLLERHARESKKGPLRLAPETLAAIRRYSWPGNVRELDNAIARAVVLSQDEVITPDLLGLAAPDSSTTLFSAPVAYLDLPYHESMEAHSVAIIRRALERAGGNQTKAAELLKLQRTYLARLIKQKGISVSGPSVP